MIFTLGFAALSIVPAAPATAGLPNRPASPEAEFLIAAHQGNLAQIKAGKIAARKGESSAVRKLGKRFASYHKKLDSQVRAVSEDLHVSLPDEPNSEQRQLAAQYKAASATEFDTLFVTTQITNYERAAKLAGTVLKITTDPAVQRIVEAATPVIEQNREALTTTRDQLGLDLPRE
ncbi:DUF4142 domain-containing protein [Actinoplanes derwentensis]|uniref:Putative membrane protein n=1 Tax=Actinoplanes derwentensis TaxID=113562 RepID=A0A1H2CMX0_9ACTN|nr:DUF4142 domain-containing protein [Actinoplanes derwentensis]GID86218.1 hypothetical protein Ade03nite_51420 [Actinoplanes derwentensis]SDT71833.1 putative membrane protein [Actinoplanes derwentensis]